VGNFKYVGAALSKKGGRMRKSEKMNLEQCLLNILNVLLSFLLSDNITSEIQGAAEKSVGFQNEITQ
jgi:hypothetical protein